MRVFFTYQLGIVAHFAFATILPALAGIVLTRIADREPLARMTYLQKQVLYGIVFGTIAIFGTEFGIKTHDATMNVRDAAPLVAGLYFGSPAGIIAGIIGGVERWFAALWGRGMFTRVACSVATIFAGFYAAALNRLLFDDRRPSWPFALAVGAVAEVLHLLLVFVTNLDNGTHAFLVAQACSLPMISCNAIGVALAGAAIALASGQSIRRKSSMRDISQVIQSGLLSVVVVGFISTVGFTFTLQQSVSYTEAADTLTVELRDVQEDIRDTAEANILALARRAARVVPSVDDATDKLLVQLASELNVSEVHVVDEDGIIVSSSDKRYVGFDMHSGDQARAFLDLLPHGRSSYYVQNYRPSSIDENESRKYAGVRIEDGFIQVGYDGEHFIADVSEKIRFSVANRHVGHAGFIVVLTEDGTLVGTRSDVRINESVAEHLLADAEKGNEGNLYRTALRSTDYYAICRTVEGFRAIALLPVEEATQNRDLSVLIVSFMEVIVFAALFAAVYILIRRVVVSSIWQVNGTLGKITSGDLEAKVDVRKSTEFSSLSDDINATVGALRDAIAAESARIERDLATAKAIQESALPRTFPPFPDIDAFDLYASMKAAREVGGDFYDFFLVDDHTLGFLIADVSGKGIPASLFMMAAKSELSNYITSGMDLAEAVHSANRNLCKGNDAGMFVTVWAAKLDYDTGELTFVNAGHNPPLLRHQGAWQWLKQKGGLFLGTFETAKYRTSTITLEPGDELLLYTDGVNEAFNADGEEYGNDRLEAFLAAHTNMHPHILVGSLREEVHNWSAGTEQSDDITMLCLEFGAPPEVSGSITVPATREGLAELLHGMHYELSQVGCPAHVQRQIDLTVEELFANAVQHGYAGKVKDARIQLEYIYNARPDSIVMSITDWSPEFNPLKYEHTSEEDDLAGVGIALAIKDMDDFAYVRDEDRNVIAFRKTW